MVQGDMQIAFESGQTRPAIRPLEAKRAETGSVKRAYGRSIFSVSALTGCGKRLVVQINQVFHV
jgi:hypothetical protein